MNREGGIAQGARSYVSRVGNPAPTHDLIRRCQPGALSADAPVHSWVELALQRTPWVVVRRGHLRRGMLPVMVRGAARHRRFAGFAAHAAVAERTSPEDLIDRCRDGLRTMTTGPLGSNSFRMNGPVPLACRDA